MNKSPGFRSPQEELEYLTREISEIKVVLHDIGARLTQLERHAKRAFGVSVGSSVKREAAHGKSRPDGTETPTITPVEARQLFDELTVMWRVRESRAVEQRLTTLGTADLKLLAHELGVSFRSQPSRRQLIGGIVGRVNESVLLSTNRNVTAPRSVNTQTPDTNGGRESGPTSKSVSQDA